MEGPRGRPDTARGAASLPASVVLGLHPRLESRGGPLCSRPSGTGAGRIPPTSPLSLRSLLPLLDPDSGLLILAGKVSETREWPS